MHLPLMGRTTSHLTLFLVFLQAILTTSINITQNNTMCSWTQVRAAVIRDTLYLDGGYLWWQGDFVDGSTSDPASDDNLKGDMYLFNFSTPFDTTTTNLTTVFTLMPKSVGAPNNIAPNYMDGTMFANDGELYMYGGLARLTDSSTPQGA